MSKRAVLYARVSSDDTRNEGRNLNGQLAMCREHAASRGWAIVAELAEDDRGASGASFELPQLTAVLDMAQARQFDVLVVREIDRLSRNLAKQLAVERELKHAGVQIEYVLGTFADTPEGNLLKNVRASIAEFERELIAQRSTRGRRLKAKAGNVITHGEPPYGYRVIEEDGKRTFTIAEQEAAIVRMIFDWYTEGDGERESLGSRAIAKKLSELKILTQKDARRSRGAKLRQPREWSPSTVCGMLSNETYCGVWHYGKCRHGDKTGKSLTARDLIPVEVPGIVSREQWEKAQRRKQRNREEAQRNMKNHYLMSKRLICSECGCRVSGISRVLPAATYQYYACSTNSEKIRHCSIRTNFRADRVDEAVWAWVKSLLTDPTALEAGIQAHVAEQERAQKPLRDRLVVLQDLIKENQGQLNRLLDLYLTEGFPREMLMERKRRLEDTLRSLVAEESKVQASLQGQLLDQDQLNTLREFAQQIGAGLDQAEQDFGVRRRIIETLDVRGRLAVEEDQRVVYLECVLGGTAFEMGAKRRLAAPPSATEAEPNESDLSGLSDANISSRTCDRDHRIPWSRRSLR